jgi:hypothetical protein
LICLFSGDRIKKEGEVNVDIIFAKYKKVYINMLIFYEVGIITLTFTYIITILFIVLNPIMGTEEPRNRG